MNGKKIIYYLLAAFVAGNILLIYIQYNSTKNINTLISSNEKILNEIDVINNLRELKRDIISEDSTQSFLHSIGATPKLDMKEKIEKIQYNLDNLQRISDDDSSVKYIDVLDLLVHKKLDIDAKNIDSSSTYAQKSREEPVASVRMKMLTDSIRIVTKTIENSRQKLLAKVTLAVDKSGTKALNLGTTLIVLVLSGGAILFWIIIATIRRQNQLIHQLHLSEKKARDAVMIKEKFMANMSHEIRTPMNAVLGFTNLLQRKNLDNEGMQYVEIIQKSGENLLTIINDILDLSKIEAGMMRIEQAPFNIRGLVDSVNTMFMVKAAEKELLLSAHVDESLPEIMEGDGTRLTQILVNLIGNAIKFTDKGQVTIKITNEGIQDNIIQTGITVSDTGIGIEKEKFHRVFERFQQAEDEVTRKYGGTGLGLSIVNELVILQNGSIDVESKPGVGTTFKLIIPYKTSSTNSQHVFIAAEPFDYNNFKKINILLVEDNTINQSLIKHLFKAWQINFDLAKNGKEAIEQLKVKQYNLILMDIQMPVMDGYSCTLEIRHNLNINVPIIAMTAHAMNGEREKCLSFGMNDYLSKPIREEQLHQLISLYTNMKFDKVKEGTVKKNTPANYSYIDLQYMKEVGQGDKQYEKTVTGQFIEMITYDLQKIETAWWHNNISEMRTTAHNMKTSISVMGLNEVLQSCLDALEYDNLHEEEFQKKFSYLKFICNAALQEAKQFSTTL